MAAAPLTWALVRDLLRHLSMPPPEKIKPYQGGRPRSGSGPARLAYSQETGQHLSPWTTLTFPQMTVKGSPLYPCLLTLHCPLPASPPFGRVQFIVRPRPGTATSHRRAPVPRVGSPTYWVPCLAAPPSGYRLMPGSQPRHIRMAHRTRGPAGILPHTPHITSSPKRTVFKRLPACTLPLALPHP